MRLNLVVPLALSAALLVPAAVLGDHLALAAPRQQHDPAQAPGVTAELLLLHGTNNNTGIDPRLGKIPALTKPPFSAYNSYDLVRRDALALARNHPATLPLPNKGELAVTYQGATQKAGPKKYLVDLSIQKHGSSILPLLQVSATPGEMMFAAVPGYKNGVLVIGVKIVP